MKKQTKQKFKNIWYKIKKPLAVFSIILNILFALALIIGVSSKPKAQSVSASDNQITDLTGTTWTLDSPLNLSYASFTSYVNFDTYNSSNQIRNCTRFTYSQNGTIKYTYTNSGGGTITLNNSGNPQVPSSLESYLTITFTGGTGVTDSSLIGYLLTSATNNSSPDEPEEPDNEYNYIKSITLGDNFNPVTYIAKNGDYIFNGFAGLNDTITANYIDLIGLDFVSNGFEYNRIRFVYATLSSVAPYITQDGTSYISTSQYSSYACCIGMFYQYLDTSNNVIRNVQVTSYRRTIIEDSGTQIKCYDVRQPYTIWVNNNYRQIDVITDDETIISDSHLSITGLTSYQLLQVTSSVNDSVMGLTDVFGLLKGAFSGITGILAISILPGITLGLLLFIPLIVTIIITVVRLIKK